MDLWPRGQNVVVDEANVDIQPGEMRDLQFEPALPAFAEK